MSPTCSIVMKIKEIKVLKGTISQPMPVAFVSSSIKPNSVLFAIDVLQQRHFRRNFA